MGGTTIGQRVRLFRDWRQMTLEQVAGLVGMSRSWLSKVERGELPLYRSAHINALSEALRISPAELTGSAGPTGSGQPATHASIVAVRGALLDNELGERLMIDPRPVAELTAAATRALTLLVAGDYAGAAEPLPDLINELHAHAASRTEPDALRALAMACVVACCIAKNLGFADLSWIAADRGRQAAQLLEDPAVVGYCEFYVSHALEPYSCAYRNSLRALGVLQPFVREGLSMQTYGMLHLMSAFGAVVAGRTDEMSAHLREASELAAKTGDQPSMGLYFGPTNVGIWQVALAVEAGEGGRVRELAKTVPVDSIGSRIRRAAYYSDLGRGYAQDGDDAAAIEALSRAERVAPQRIHNNQLVRDVVSDLLMRARRAAGGPQLHGLARRMNLY